MPVFSRDDHRVLFVHIPKTGGTSVEHHFRVSGWHVDFFDTGEAQYSKNQYMKCSPQHLNAKQLQTVLRLSAFHFVFTIVREPVERTISEYNWRRKHLGLTSPFDSWIEESLNLQKTNQYILDNHLSPQTTFFASRNQSV